MIQEKVVLRFLGHVRWKRRTKSGRAICERCAAEGRLYSFWPPSTYVTAKERLPAVLSVIYEQANDPALSIKIYTERLRPKGLPFSGFWYLKEGKFVFSVCKKTKRTNRCILRL